MFTHQVYINPEWDAALFGLGIFIFMIVGYWFIQVFMVAFVGLVFAIPGLIYTAILATFGSVIFFIGKYTMWFWKPLFSAIGFLWLLFVKIAAVTAIVAGIAWLVGYGYLVSYIFHHVVGVF